MTKDYDFIQIRTTKEKKEAFNARAKKESKSMTGIIRVLCRKAGINI